MKTTLILFASLLLLLTAGSAFAQKGSGNYEETISDEVALAFGGAYMVVMFAIVIFMAFVQWKVFEKAGQPGWACLVPIYNIIIMIRIAKQPEWWILLFFVPGVNFVIAILVSINIARNYGQSDAFAAGLILLPIVFYPILAFGDAQYEGVSSRAESEDYSDQCKTDRDSRFHQ